MVRSDCIACFHLTGVITRRGVWDPTPRDIYVPVLRELKTLGIECIEKSFHLDL